MTKVALQTLSLNGQGKLNFFSHVPKWVLNEPRIPFTHYRPLSTDASKIGFNIKHRCFRDWTKTGGCEILSVKKETIPKLCSSLD